jgi:DNA polymerase-4/DNA polymerase V
MFENIKNNIEWILHIDGDGFFAACEVARKPEYFGKPVVVGHERGVATALTYPAKDIGIKRGDPVFKIRKEYPDVPILSSHFELYNHYSRNLANILLDYVDELEIYSIDECFATLKGEIDSVKDKVEKMKEIVQRKLGITYSFGVSVNKTLAKVGSKHKKPNGLCFLMDKESILLALKETKVEKIWGIGPATASKLFRNNIFTAYEYANSNARFILKSDFTKPVEETYIELRGESAFFVGVKNPHQKSIQSTRTFMKRLVNKRQILSELYKNIETCSGELRRQDLYTNSVYIFVQRDKGQGEKIFYEVELPFFTQSSIEINKYVERVFDKYGDTLPGIYKKSGIQANGLKQKDEIALDMFGDQENKFENEKPMNVAIDKLREKYGFQIVQTAASLNAFNGRNTDQNKRESKDNYEYGLPYPFLGQVI